MASSTEICNLALSHLGSTKRIANLSTEQSTEAALFRVFYETCLDLVLRDYRWPFASTIAALGLIEDDPNEEWSYSYSYPTDCLEIRRILSGVRNDARDSRVPYKIAYSSAGRILYCDIENAEAEYTIRITDPQLYPPDFIMALSFRLASYAAPALTAGDPFKMGDRAMKMYQYEISKATATSFNEEQPDQDPDSEFIRARS